MYGIMSKSAGIVAQRHYSICNGRKKEIERKRKREQKQIETYKLNAFKIFIQIAIVTNCGIAMCMYSNSISLYLTLTRSQWLMPVDRGILHACASPNDPNIERIMCVQRSLERIDYPLIFGKHTLSELIIATTVSLQAIEFSETLKSNRIISNRQKQHTNIFWKNVEHFPFLIRHFCYLIAVRMCVITMLSLVSSAVWMNFGAKSYMFHRWLS